MKSKRKYKKRNKMKVIAFILIIAIATIGVHWAVNADTEEITITFEDAVLCTKVAEELRTYKNNEDDKAVNYLKSSTDKSVTISQNNLPNIKKLNLAGSATTSSGDLTNQITNLSGISGFTYLEQLNLDNNTRISSHDYPQSNIYDIYKLTNLKVLSLAGTAIYNSDIYNSQKDNISALTNLEELNLSSTNIDSSGLYSELSSLRNLKKLNLSNNKNIKNISSIIEWVKDLNIDNTGITNIEDIGRFSELEKLYMGHNSIGDLWHLWEKKYIESQEIEILPLQNLKQLNLDYMNENYKTGNIFSSLQCFSLTSLSLRGNNIYDLSGLTIYDENKNQYGTDEKEKDDNQMQYSLKYLDLADNNIENTEGLVDYKYVDDNKVVAKVLDVSTLILTNNQINDITQLGYLDSLETLRLGNNRIEDISPISRKTFEDGNLELYGQRLSVWVHKDEQKNKDFQYMILPPIIRDAKREGSLVYASNVNLVTTNCNFNNDKQEYSSPSNLNVKISTSLENETEINVSVRNGLADGTKIKYTFDSYYDERNEFNTQYGPIETLKFNDQNLDDAIYRYLRANTEDFGIYYLSRVPFIININRSAIDQINKLELSNSRITDIEGLQSFTSVRDIDLSRNQIKTAQQLKYMNYLQKINLSQNELGNSYSFINNLYELRFLDLSSNGVSSLNNLNTLYNNLSKEGREPELQELHLGTNNLSDISVVANFRKITNLSLNKNKVEDISALSNLSQLGIANLSENKISNIESLRNLNNITKLYLDNNQLTNIDVVGNLNKIQELAISSNSISDLTPLKYRTLLKVFYANDNKIEDVAPIDDRSHSLLTDSDGKLEVNKQKLTYRLTNQESRQESVRVELPPIFRSVQNSSSMVKTVEDFNVANCELTDTNNDSIIDSVIVKPSEINGKNAVVTIIGGRADKTTFTIGQPPVPTITYNPQNNGQKIKGSVEATITFDKNNVTITNNNGSNKYTFTENKEFTFKYVDEDGFDGEETAKVDWLDNTSPKLSIRYETDEKNKSVTTIITADEPIQGVNGWNLSSDKKTIRKTYTETTKETITVKDEVGNETKANINITIEEKQEEKVESSTYTVDNTNKIITNITHDTKKSDFENKMNITGTTYRIVNRKGQDITSSGLVTTGSKIITGSNQEYTIIVVGDANYDGKVGITDLSKITNEYVSSKTTLEDIQKKALDMNGNGKIDITDLSKLANLYTSLQN